MQQKTLVLMDFDGTLTKGDTLSRFLLFAVPPRTLVVGTISVFFHFLKLICLRRWSNGKGKEVVLSTFFKGKSRETLDQLGQSFSQERLPRLLRPEMLAKLEEHQNASATIALVSASPDIWLQPFCTSKGIYLICTALEYQKGHFTGRLATPNCTGREKEHRIRAAFDLSTFKRIIAYGNSAGDAEMLAMADEAWMIR